MPGSPLPFVGQSGSDKSAPDHPVCWNVSVSSWHPCYLAGDWTACLTCVVACPIPAQPPLSAMLCGLAAVCMLSARDGILLQLSSVSTPSLITLLPPGLQLSYISFTAVKILAAADAKVNE